MHSHFLVIYSMSERIGNFSIMNNNGVGLYLYFLVETSGINSLISHIFKFGGYLFMFIYIGGGAEKFSAWAKKEWLKAMKKKFNNKKVILLLVGLRIFWHSLYIWSLAVTWYWLDSDLLEENCLTW